MWGVIIYKNQSQKIDVLLYYEKAFREDWRFLSRLRLITGGIFIGLVTSIIGWVLRKYQLPLDFNIKCPLIIIVSIISLIAVLTIGWFGSSLNVLKRFMVNIQDALGLYDNGIFIQDSIADVESKNWGLREKWYWGKAIFAAFFIGLLFIIFLIFI